MTELELNEYLHNNFPKENEKCEWKEFKTLKQSVSGREGDDIISYVSAIANMNGGHLIIGIEDGTLKVIGIQDFQNYTIDNIKLKLLDDCPNLSSELLKIVEIVTTDTGKTIWIFHIPKHSYRLPVYAHKKTWQRVNDSLVKMTRSRLDAILSETLSLEDWSAGIISDATLEDLDPEAIGKARIEFAKRNPNIFDDLLVWDNGKFLDKAKITIQGQITRTAIILLGNGESEHFISPGVAQIRWNLKSEDNQDRDFEIFQQPFVLAVDLIYAKIRNLKYRYIQTNSLFPDEVLRYDPFTIRELLNNCIAHQDYSQAGMINITEFEDDRLVFTNIGSFIPDSVETVVLKDTPEEFYRNRFLVGAMRNLGMIETQGGGIRKVFTKQKERFFPLPDYDLSNSRVKVTVTVKVLDINFARILISNPTLSLQDLMLLDKVQKKLPVSEVSARYLRQQKWIEGRKPNYYLSGLLVAATDDAALKAQYIKNRSFDDDYCKNLILEYIKKYKEATRKDLDALFLGKLSDALSEAQKKKKLSNLLSDLSRQEKIYSDSQRVWRLV